MTNPYLSIVDETIALTNQQLSGRIASVSRLTSSELNRLAPLKRDKEEFIRLMSVVRDETTEEEKIAYLRDNVATVGKVIVGLLKTIA